MIVTIKKGTNNDTKFRVPNVWTGAFEKTWEIGISPDNWYDWSPNPDQKDINKLIGVTEFWSANNKNSMMVGWNPCLLSEEEIHALYPHTKNLKSHITRPVKYFNIFMYWNDENGGHTEQLVTVIADWEVNQINVTFKRSKGSKMISADFSVYQYKHASLNIPSVSPYYVLQDLPMYLGTLNKSLLRDIFFWFGGNNTAPQDMQFRLT